MTSPWSFSYRLVPPAISSLPSASWVWPVQNRSLGVGIFLKVFLSGSHSTVSNFFASKFLALLPDPATSRTLPVCSSAAWIVLSRNSLGTATVSQWPLSALYPGWLIL